MMMFSIKKLAQIFFIFFFSFVLDFQVLAFSTCITSSRNTCSLLSSTSDDIIVNNNNDDGGGGGDNKDIINSNEWSVTDDWSSLSSVVGTVENSNIDSSKLFNQDFVTYAAREMERQYEQQQMMMMIPTYPPSKEDTWISDAIDEIHNSFSTLPLYDTGFEEYTVQQDDDGNNNNNNFASTMDQEIAMLVRCNEHPEELLIYEGRALAPLTDKESNDPFQLVEQHQQQQQATTTTTNYFRMTPFLKESVSKMFHTHAIPDPRDGVLSLDRKGVARWMTKCLQSEEKTPVSAHEKRCLLYTSPSPRDLSTSRMPSSA